MPTFPPIRGLSPLGFGGDIGASQLYFVHTPEVAQDLHAGAVASANRRYFTYRQALSELFPEGDADESEAPEAPDESTALSREARADERSS